MNFGDDRFLHHVDGGNAPALSRESALAAIRLDEGIQSGGGGCVLPLLRSRGSEEAQRRSGDQMALEIEGIVDGGVGGEKTLGGSG